MGLPLPKALMNASKTLKDLRTMRVSARNAISSAQTQIYERKISPKHKKSMMSNQLKKAQGDNF
jgi:hypothetical protein